MAELVYHGPEDEPYYVTDSEFGIARAANDGSPAIDLNIRTCRANTWRPWRRKRRGVIVHWSRWWEHGFKARPGTRVPKRKIERLKLHQVRNLVSGHGGHEILTIEEGIDLCQRHEIFPFFEMKPSRWPAHVLDQIRAHAGAARWPVVLTTIQCYGDTARARSRWERKAYARMWLAHHHTLHTCLLYRRPLSWEHWAPVLTGIKNTRGRHGVLGLHELIGQLNKERH